MLISPPVNASPSASLKLLLPPICFKVGFLTSAAYARFQKHLLHKLKSLKFNAFFFFSQSIKSVKFLLGESSIHFALRWPYITRSLITICEAPPKHEFGVILITPTHTIKIPFLCCAHP